MHAHNKQTQQTKMNLPSPPTRETLNLMMIVDQYYSPLNDKALRTCKKASTESPSPPPQQQHCSEATVRNETTKDAGAPYYCFSWFDFPVIGHDYTQHDARTLNLFHVNDALQQEEGYRIPMNDGRKQGQRQ
mmetsp:Transcript_22275/g.34035  ORF Transcript_22275/g.34035 Transcript_22275/m.34035 type:complete len:132 (+) Transcript_22275:345-740(+)